MFNGKLKAITFSYDDGVTQDAHLIHLMNKYGIQSTFNLNSGLMGDLRKLELGPSMRTVSHIKFRPDEIKDIYAGHEVAAHTLRHPPLINKPQILYIWGHSYSLDFSPEGWEAIEKLFQMISGKDDIFYGTNSEVLLAGK